EGCWEARGDVSHDPAQAAGWLLAHGRLQLHVLSTGQGKFTWLRSPAFVRIRANRGSERTKSHCGSPRVGPKSKARRSTAVSKAASVRSRSPSAAYRRATTDHESGVLGWLCTSRRTSSASPRLPIRAWTMATAEEMLAEARRRAV